ncbi:Uncharacterized protein OS=Chthoniobacter flavus Ellin428 GN=CfE428DRAFT_5396 PE=4 SV=1 [Gemmataceae bacterium]|nr:Uncharacterized protein OS=Chthoniobacter flavus Ellin428 GN=CfE428DRAFT_5396 PE=4 SV=1 [Gemmataceae bacterium]VTU01151.1 Uncharacterized protein OS=Chthoniobacter flavus Ellin428 GN=CfE428DRAFT_5396 PE=4 SV=1 [Gemmataceae bacterium]
MYPSGRWDGFWVQGMAWGRQAMTPFTLTFAAGEVTGSGRDVVGPFTVAGTYDEATGRVRMVKQYVGKHRVLYVGLPDGEGSIQGTWAIDEHNTGPFLLRPALAKPTGGEPIQDVG